MAEPERCLTTPSSSNESLFNLAHIQHACAALLLMAMTVLLFTSMRNESPTTDEPMHLTRGVAFYWGRGAPLSWAHPPLGNAFAALPIALRENIDVTSIPGYANADTERVAEVLLGSDYPQRRGWFSMARSMIAVLTVLLGAYLYLFGRALFGPMTALIGVFFYALHPTLVAHGRLVTTDMPVTFAMVIGVGEFVLYLAGKARWHAFTGALMVGIAFATKYTAALLVPTLLALGAAYALLRAGRFTGLGRARALLHIAQLAVLFGVVSLLIINAAYGFSDTCMRVDTLLARAEPTNEEFSRYEGRLLEDYSSLHVLPDWVRVPLPYTYLLGITYVKAHSSNGHPTLFFGKQYVKGHIAYFPVLLAIKTPVLLLAALSAALVVLVRKRGKVSAPALAIGLYAVLTLLLAMRSSINIGIRHILPIVPYLALLGALGVVACGRALGEAKFRTRIAWALAGAHALGMAWAFPDYLTDFNALVGGRALGQQISVVGEEWDQDMMRLGAALQAHGVTRVQFVTTRVSALELRQFGVRVERVQCGPPQRRGAFLVVNARQRLRKQSCYGWLENHEPIIAINNHLWVFNTVKGG